LVLAAQLEHLTAAAITVQILLLVLLQLQLAAVAGVLTWARHLPAVRVVEVLLGQTQRAQAELVVKVLQAAMVLK
jgi:hypothetical protein